MTQPHVSVSNLREIFTTNVALKREGIGKQRGAQRHIEFNIESIRT
jgi:hypothetical protein